MFTLITDLGPVDLLAEVAGLGSFDEVKESTVVVDAFGREVRTLGLPTLSSRNAPPDAKRTCVSFLNSRACWKREMTERAFSIYGREEDFDSPGQTPHGPPVRTCPYRCGR
jgi:hypothetical protein